MSDKLRGAFHGCPHHGDDYEACIQHSGTAPCGVTEERDRFSRLFANACESLGAVQEALANEDAPEAIGLEAELVKELKGERDALAAHYAQLLSAGWRLKHELQQWSLTERDPQTSAVLAYWDAATDEKPSASLAHLVAESQAEALEEAADCTVPAMHKMANWLRARATETRRQAGEAAK